MDEQEVLGVDDVQPCYIYNPAGTTAQRPKKRRKVSRAIENPDSHHASAFLPLFEGRESPGLVTARANAYEYAWGKQEETLKDMLNMINSQTVKEIVDFVTATDPVADPCRIPAGLITSGVSAIVSHSMFTSIVNLTKESEEILAISLASSQCTSLKSALKAIIRNAKVQEYSSNEDDDVNTGQGGNRLLDYDLQVLYEHMQTRALTRTVIYFENSESIDGNVLADVVDVLASWQDRVPVIVLFEIATSIDLFQEKLTRSTLRRLQGTYFETKSTAETLEQMFKAVTEPDLSTSLYIGANVYKMLLDRQMEYVQNAHAFVESLKYIHMQHYFVNALSCLLDNSEPPLRLQSEHWEDIRNLPSFRRYIETLTASTETSRVKKLLSDDKYLEIEARRMVRNGQQTLRELHNALKILEAAQSSIPSKSKVPWSNLWLKALSGDLSDSPTVRDLLLSVKKLHSVDMQTMLETIRLTVPKNSDFDDALAFQHEIIDLTNLREDTSRPLRSEHDNAHETIRTTVISQKVQLSKHKSTLSKEDAAYSAIVDRIHETLSDFFTTRFIQPKRLPLHEIFLFDTKSAAREVFAPAPRQAIERALSAPHDYLDCDCCDGKENGLSATQPPTAILYQLYLESGSLINIADLWSAFKTILEPENADMEEQEAQTLALFYRGLAELRYLGMIKNSRKKTDHLAKLAWKGL